MPSEEGLLKNLVKEVQTHRHSTYCKRSGKCRFHFPRVPSSKTLIASQPDSDDCNSQEIKQCMDKVRKLLVEGKTDVSIEELIKLAQTNQVLYEKAISTASSGAVIVLKRDPKDCFINNYNENVLVAWQANHDVQYVMNAYACIMYVASYITKSEKTMGALLNQVASEERTSELTQQLRKIGAAFLNHRQLSSQEGAYRLLSLPMTKLSRDVNRIDTNPKEERITVLKNLAFLQKDDNDVFCKSNIQRYTHRPPALATICLAEFVATYRVKYGSTVRNDDDDDHNHDNESIQEGDGANLREIKLLDGFGTMTKRKSEAVISFFKFSKDSDPTNYYRSRLLLYLPWYVEETDLLSDYNSYEAHHNDKLTEILANERKYTATEIGDIRYDEQNHPQHVWDQLAPGTEHNRGLDNDEGQELERDLSQEDIDDNTILINDPSVNSSRNGPAELAYRFEGAANKDIIPPEEYRSLIRGLNKRQRQIVTYHRKWCKEAVLALKEGKNIKPYHIFVSGPGGVGKSHIIRIIQSDTIRLLKLSGVFEPDEVIILLTAPTGVAAFNIGGMTLHSALMLGCNKYGNYQSLSHDKINTLRTRLSKLKLLIIDEVSMLGSSMLLDIHKRLNEILVQPHDVLFGNISLLAVGDLYQLPPVGQPPVFSTMSRNTLACLYGSGSLWREHFKMLELDEIMRQRGDVEFVELLGRVRTGNCTNEDIQVLKSREIMKDSPGYPTQALHVYRTNESVDKRNEHMLSALACDDEQYVIEAQDSATSETQHINMSNLSKKKADTGNLHHKLRLAVGAKVMLTINVNVTDGLVNGARGEVLHFITDSNMKVKKILVKFNDKNVGKQAINTSPYRHLYSNAVPIGKVEAKFLAMGKKGAEVTRYQFPLTLAFATTIHKVQGLTLDQIVVDMEGSSHFNPGQAYVAFSRVKTLDGLYLIGFNHLSIKASEKVKEEMSRLQNQLIDPNNLVHHIPCTETTIAFLNVRSINAKLEDIKVDTILENACILGFCETWLAPNQESPFIRQGHTIIRCDRIFDNSHGGVMLSMPQFMCPRNTLKTNRPGIEILANTVTLTNHLTIQIVLIYRSPNIPLRNLIQAMMDLLNSIDFSLPTVIIGDINEDLLDDTANVFLTFMNENSYHQVVRNPTTDRGSMIDHVYCNNILGNIFTKVNDCYYSDHDIVLCTIPS